MGVGIDHIEKVTFEGGEGSMCVNYPVIHLEEHHWQREPQAKAPRWDAWLVEKVQGGQCGWDRVNEGGNRRR